MRFPLICLLLTATFTNAQSGATPLRWPYSRVYEPDVTITFERWMTNRRLAGRKLIIFTDDPENELVQAIQKEIPEVVLMSPAEAANFSDSKGEDPLIILVGSKKWHQYLCDKLLIYVSIRGDRILPILLPGQRTEDSLPIFTRRYWVVRLPDEAGVAPLMAKQIKGALLVPNILNTNSSTNALRL